MSATTTPTPGPKTNHAGLTVLDYRGGKTTLCAGCGHNAITERIIDAMYEMGVPPERVASGKEHQTPMGSQVATTTILNGLTPPDGVMIRTENLWKTYEMGAIQVNALCGVSFEIHRSEYVAIMGPSGSGKSTLMNLIGCLDSPSKGGYWINGHLEAS